MRIEKTATNWCVGITVKEFRRIMQRDDEAFDNDEQDLAEILGSIDGIEYVEYNGHFGPNIFFRMDEPYSQKKMSKIERIIRDYME